MARRVDYVVGRVLPYMQQTPASDTQAILDFTVSEAQQLRLTGLPVMMNHNDGTTDDRTGRQRHLDRVGTVEGMGVRGVDARVLMAVDPAGSPSAMYTSNAVAKGLYEGISLGNTVASKASADTGRTTLIKTPTEVSLCTRGRRFGSTIEHFMPGRPTLERLYDDGAEVIASVARRFAYAVPDVSAASRAEYIDAFAQASDNRLASVRATERLHAQKPSIVRIQASDSPPPPMSEDAPPQSEAAAPVDAMETDAPAATEASPESVTSEMPEVPDVRNAKEMAALAIKREEETLDLRRQLAEAQKAQTELKSIREAEHTKKKEQFEEIVRSFVQHAKQAKVPEDQIETTVSAAQNVFQSNPETALKQIDTALQLSVRASENVHSLETMQAQQMAARATAENDAFFTQAAARLAAARDQGRAFDMSAGTKVSFDSMKAGQFATADAKPVVQESHQTSFKGFVVSQPPASSSFDRRFSSQQVQAPPMQQNVEPMAAEKPAAQLFVRASEADAGTNDYDALAQFKKQIELTGRIPCMREVEMGVALEYTGQNKASASGEQVPEMRVVPLRRAPAAVEPANFAPEWDRMLMRAMAENPNKNARHLMQMTQAGGGYMV